MFVETEFLSLAQALESFHRLTGESQLESSNTFRSVLKQMRAAIKSCCKTPRLASRMSDAIQYANEPSFKERIQSLIRCVSRERARALLGDPDAFEQTLRQTRNFFTHPGIKRQSHVLTSPKAIFLFNQKLHAFLRILVLMQLGFSEVSVFDVVLRQSRRWR
jgi:ApeA N-terminal domain 1